MCGRYRLTRPERFAELNHLSVAADCRPRYNVAPTQLMPVVLDKSPETLTELRWGLVPSWAKDWKIGNQCINARSETVATKPTFRTAWKKRRCLVPADGFYEWQKCGRGKTPHDITMRDGEPFAFAGLWEIWRDPAQGEDAPPVRTFSIITGQPNDLVRPIHDRMPVIIPREKYCCWLSSGTSLDECTGMLQPFPAELMSVRTISPLVNSPRNDDASLLDTSHPYPALL